MGRELHAARLICTRSILYLQRPTGVSTGADQPLPNYQNRVSTISCSASPAAAPETNTFQSRCFTRSMF